MPETTSPFRARVCACAGLLLLLTSAALAAVASPAAAVPVPDCATAGYAVTSLGGPNFYIDSGASPEFRSSYTGYRVANQTGVASADLYVRLSDFSGGALGLAAAQSATERLGDLAPAAGGSLFWYLTASGATGTAQRHAVTVYRHDPALPTAVPLCTTSGGFETVATTLSASANKVTGISLTGGAPKLGSTFTITVTGSTGTIGSGITGDAYSMWMSPAVTETWPAGAFRLLSTSLTMSPDGTAAAQTWTDRLRVAGLGTKDRDYTATYTFRAVGFTSTAAQVRPVQQISSGTQIKHTGSYSVTLPAITPPVNDLTATATASPATLDTGGGEVGYEVAVHGTAGAELDAVELELPTGATPVPGGVTWAGQPAADAVSVGGTWHAPGPFVVPVGGGTLRVRVTHDPTPGARTSRIRGVVGPSYVGTTTTPLDGTNAATVTVRVNRAPFAHDAVANADSEGDLVVPVADLATDPDGDPVTLAGASAPAASVELVEGGLHYVGNPPTEGEPVAFTVTDGRGATSSATLTVFPAGTAPQPQPQSLDVSAADSVLVGRDAQVDATASSGLAPAFVSLSPATCTVGTDGEVHGLSTGTCTVEVTQAGDTTWAAAAPVRHDLTVVRRPQHLTTTGTQPSAVEVGSSVTVSAASDESLPLAWTSSTPETCAVEPTTGAVTGLAAGACTLVATQPGDDAVDPADPLEVGVLVAAASSPPSAPDAAPAPGPEPEAAPEPAPVAQTLDLRAPERVLAGPGSVAVRATSTASLPVSVAVVAGPCLLDGASLTVPAVGTCVLEASQPGATGVAAAAPVRTRVEVVRPVDDTLVVPGAGDRSAAVDPLANDPVGLRLVDVGSAAHGVVSIVAGRAAYRAADGYRGADTFDYTVADALGRTATATVAVDVLNAAPTVRAARLAQVAGTTRTVRVDASDPNDDALSVTASAEVADVAVSVRGRSVSITPGAGVSGIVRVQVRVEDGAGGTVSTTYVDTVSPPPVSSARRVITAGGTRISWPTARTADATYAVLADGRVVCRTALLSCSSRRVLGPAIDVAVRVLGADRTTSADRAAVPEGDRQVLMATVYFGPGADTLTSRQDAALQRVVDRILTMGFRSADLQGYTDSDGGAAYNLRLSRRRTQTVAELLGRRDIGSTQAWFGMDDPASDNQSPAGKAANRRVEIYVGF